jgi:DNA modification methylase
MATTSIYPEQQSNFTNQIHHGDCIEIMQQMPANSVDFILTDPPLSCELSRPHGTQHTE